MVTDVDNAHGAGAGGSVGAGVGATDVGDVEAGNGTAVTTMTTTMKLTLMHPILPPNWSGDLRWRWGWR